MKPGIENLSINPGIFLTHTNNRKVSKVSFVKAAAFPMKRSGSFMLPVIFAHALSVMQSSLFFLPSEHLSRLAKVFLQQ